MGFSTEAIALEVNNLLLMSQSLSGWGGVFNIMIQTSSKFSKLCRNPFQGGVGFSTQGSSLRGQANELVAIPFRVGWGFQLIAIGS